MLDSVHPALPGTNPKPFWEHENGQCRFILDPATTLTCCAPADGPFCPGHHTSLYRTEPRANLERSMKKYLTR